MKKGVSRFSVSVPEDLLNEFDKAIQDMGYKDRSKAIQMAMRNIITEYSWTEREGGLGVGAIMMIYDHKVRGVGEALTDIQHDFGEVINSTTHIHLDEHNCLEIIFVKGENRRIKDLSRELMTKRGVKQVKMTIM